MNDLLDRLASLPDAEPSRMRADRVKALYWDRNGLAIWYKRLEKGKYKWPAREAASVEISEQELALLLDGIDFTRLRRLPTVHAHAAL